MKRILLLSGILCACSSAQAQQGAASSGERVPHVSSPATQDARLKGLEDQVRARPSANFFRKGRSARANSRRLFRLGANLSSI